MAVRIKRLIIIVCCLLSQSIFAQSIYTTIIYDSIALDPDFQELQVKKEKFNEQLQDIVKDLKVDPILQKDVSRLFHDVQMGRVELVEKQLNYPFMQKVLANEKISRDAILSLTENFSLLWNIQQRLEYIYSYRRVLERGTPLLQPRKRLLSEVRRYKLNDGDKILEIGSGNIQVGIHIGRKVKEADIYLNDIDSFALKQMYYNLHVMSKSKNRITHSSNEYYIVQGSPTSTGVEEIIFDKLILRNAFHHFEYPIAMLQSIKQSMNDQSILIIKETFKQDKSICCAGVMTQSEFESILKTNKLEQMYRKKMENNKQDEVFLYQFKLDPGNN